MLSTIFPSFYSLTRIFDKDNKTPIANWKLNASLGGIDIADDGSFIAVGGTDKKLYISDKTSKSKTEIPFNEYINEGKFWGSGLKKPRAGD